MQIYNTMTRQKEDFVPVKAGEAGIYVCGPTVYNFIHIGNARPLCVFDTLRRYLEYTGYKVNYVSNITDIDDKLINLANEQGIDVKELAAKYEEEFLKDADGLNVQRPSVMPRATEHIEDIIKFVSSIIDNGYGYVAKNGDVYFRAKKFKDYGKLSHLVLEDLENNRQLSSSLEGGLKEDGADFAVWKAAKPAEPAWDSPWGRGRPGWHIECSAMAKKHLGDTFDIHAGGEDLVFPHHENEIAQSECSNGCEFSRYWMHNAFLNVDGGKMGKSLGNFTTVRAVSEEAGYEPIRYYMLSAHYRTPLNFSMEIIEQCAQSLERLYHCRENMVFALKNPTDALDEELVQISAKAVKDFIGRMDDDLNTADALAVLFDFVRDINTKLPISSENAVKTALKTFDEICGVLGILYSRESKEIPAEVKALVEERTQVRKDKNWARADEIRDILAGLGYAVEDTPQGPKIVSIN